MKTKNEKLLNENQELKEECEELTTLMQERYRPVSPYVVNGVSPSDFY